MLGKFAVVAASGLLALSIGAASAQQQPQTGANPNLDRCWDVASKSIKTKASVTGSTTSAGSATQGAASGSASGSMQGSAAADDADRPEEAKGLPVCG